MARAARISYLNRARQIRSEIGWSFTEVAREPLEIVYLDATKAFSVPLCHQIDSTSRPSTPRQTKVESRRRAPGLLYATIERAPHRSGGR